ncbi:hypothetical protein Tco_0076843 [Tanacetum coccineum]
MIKGFLGRSESFSTFRIYEVKGTSDAVKGLKVKAVIWRVAEKYLILSGDELTSSVDESLGLFLSTSLRVAKAALIVSFWGKGA